MMSQIFTRHIINQTIWGEKNECMVSAILSDFAY